jgi:hypothetical protein
MKKRSPSRRNSLYPTTRSDPRSTGFTDQDAGSWWAGTRNASIPAGGCCFSKLAPLSRFALGRRRSRRSTVITSQRPVDAWHALIGEPTSTDAILDRIVHKAHRIELDGETIRKKRSRAAKGEQAYGMASKRLALSLWLL